MKENRMFHILMGTKNARVVPWQDQLASIRRQEASRLEPLGQR